jgi:ABC-type branched-subunit amino acid transport system substrate-binding protein
MKKFLLVFLPALCLLNASSFGQTVQPSRHKIALFAPLYLDSAFDAGYSYRFDKTFPKFLNPGLEFYQGAQAALDSLDKAGAPLDVFVYDTRSRRNTLSQQINSTDLDSVDMIFAHANTAEVRILADAALQKKVPFISATLPNDGNVSNNPYYIVLNPTLRTHAEGIYKYLQQYHRNDRIIMFRKNGIQEDQIKEYIEQFATNTSGVKLKMEFENIGTAFNLPQLTSKLDTLRKTVCIAGSLDEAFGLKLAQKLASVSKDYPVTLVGMPTWDGFNLSKPEFKNMEIVYSTPFNYGKWSPLGTQLTKAFESKVNGRPTDMYFRGYETVLRFVMLLLQSNKDVASNLSYNGNYVFTQFDIQPVFLNKEDMTLDYFENKKLYFTRVVNGTKMVQ